MIRNPAGAQPRPGWAIASDDSVEAQLPRRRWRILHNAKPRMEPVGPMPNWIKTPEDFVRWLASRLSLNELYTYFRDLEAIAKMSCDLELLRFARRYLESDLAREFADDRERL
jgi:hypothetical protein